VVIEEEDLDGGGHAHDGTYTVVCSDRARNVHPASKIRYAARSAISVD
jgi:hypothetical protein